MSLLSLLTDSVTLVRIVEIIPNEFKINKNLSPPLEKICDTIQAGKYESHDRILLPKNNFSNHFSYEVKSGEKLKRHGAKMSLFYDKDHQHNKMIIKKTIII